MVERHDVETAGAQKNKPFLAACGGFHNVALPLELLAHESRQRRIIIDVEKTD
jgi:hypothetical protein